MSTQTQENQVILQEEQQIQQQINENVAQNPAFFAALLSKTENISSTIYGKSPVKSQKIENTSQKIDQQLSKFVNVLDNNVVKTLDLYNTKKQSIQSQYQSQKTNIQDKITNSLLVKKSNQYQNYIADTLETQINQIGAILLKKEITAAKKSESSEPLTSEQVVLRYKALLENASSIFFEIYAQYFKFLKNTPMFTKLEEIVLIQKIIYGVLNASLVTPLNLRVIQPTINKSLVYKARAIQYYKDQQQFAIESFQQLQNLNVQQTIKNGQEFCVVQIKAGQKQLENLLPLIQEKQKVLKGAVIEIYGNYCNITFAKEFFEQNKQKIAQTLLKVKETIESSKTQIVTQTSEIKQETKKLYENALVEYKRRKQELHEKKQQL